MSNLENATDIQQEFAYKMSKRINAQFKKTININELTENVNNLLNQNFKWKTIDAIINGKATRPNIWAVLGICDVLGLDYDILMDETIHKSKGDLKLRDKNYLNHYYGFMYLRNEDFEDPTEIELILEENDNNPTAILKYTNKETGADYKFYGTPEYNQSKDLIYIMFSNKKVFLASDASDPSLQYFHFYFEYKKFDNQMHYRKGFSVSKSKNNSCPMIMNFCIFDRKIPFEKFKQEMKALLAVGDNSFIVSKSKADEIIPKNNEDISQFFKQGNALAPVKEETVYIVDESIVISNLHHMLKQNKSIADEAYKTLLELKNESLLPIRITYDNSQHDFIKRMMDQYPKYAQLDEKQQ